MLFPERVGEVREAIPVVRRQVVRATTNVVPAPPGNQRLLEPRHDSDLGVEQIGFSKRRVEHAVTNAKNALRRVRKIGNAHIFEAAVSRNIAHRRVIDNLLGLFGGRAQPVMAHLIESGKLTRKDLKEAEALFDTPPGKDQK